MPTVTSGPEIHPLTGYEPQAQRPGAGFTPEPRPAGQLSLKLWAVPPPQVETGTELDEVKVRAVLNALVEVYGGSRSASQVRRALHPEVYQELVARPRSTGRRCTLKKAHVQQPSNGIIEACGLVNTPRRALAMCARFEEGEHGWLCTEFTVLEPR